MGGKYQDCFRGNRFPGMSGYKSAKYDRPRLRCPAGQEPEQKNPELLRSRVREDFVVRQDGETWLYSRE